MPNIRVMNWNIEQLSWNKVNIPGMVTALAHTISGQNVDIVVLLEVKQTQVANVMTTLTAALNGLPGVAGNPWVWFLSWSTGGEYYGFLVRDLNLIRPLAYAHNPNVPVSARTDGTWYDPFDDLGKLRWTTWPNNDWLAALPDPLPDPRPRIGLCDAYASRPRPRRGAKRPRFGGQPLGGGGYSMGLGFRLPCLAMFHVHTVAGDYVVPIVACHYAAVRGGRNFLAQEQVKQLRFLDAARRFSYIDTIAGPIPAAEAGYLDVDGAALLLREVMFTGDFNIDFLQNARGVGATRLQRTNHSAYAALTPTVRQGGSAAPAAAPGAAPAGPAPGVPFAAPFNPGPVTDTFPRQTLRAALTTGGSILHRYDPLLAPANTPALRGAAFDNFFYGGTQLGTAVVNFGAGNADSADVVDVPANVAHPAVPAPAPPQVDLSLVRAYYSARGTKNGNLPAAAPLAGGAALTVNARWIGARFLSDHLPVVLQFNCP